MIELSSAIFALVTGTLATLWLHSQKEISRLRLQGIRDQMVIDRQREVLLEFADEENWLDVSEDDDPAWMWPANHDVPFELARSGLEWSEDD